MWANSTIKMPCGVINRKWRLYKEAPTLRHYDEFISLSLRWRHSDHAGVSNHQPHGCLLNRLFGRKSKKTLKLRVTGLCAGNSPGTGEFPAQMASYAENISIWWRHHGWDALVHIHQDWLKRLISEIYIISHQFQNRDGRANGVYFQTYVSSCMI